MSTIKNWRLAAMPLVLGAVALPAMTSGCEDSPLGDLAAQCGLVCPEAGVLEGNASISGLANIDAFFGAVVDFTAAANTVNANVRAELDALAASVGLQAGAPAAEIAGAMKAKIDAAASGGVKVRAQEPKCQASVEVTAKAAASCDAKVDPGSVEVKCEGSCTIDASAQADCSAKGTLTCKGQAPNLQCSGTCSGNCTLEASAECSGTCRGVCSGECSVKDVNGNCAGECKGTCKGTCELKAGGECKGKCEGECEYTPPSGTCEATAEAKCEASADANIKCKGGCDGQVKPPEVSAECKAAVEAKANASVECTPPSLDISFQFKAGVNGDAQAEFKAWIENVKLRYAAMLAAAAKAEILVELGANIATQGVAAVQGAAEAIASGDVDLKASIGVGCALDELPNVSTTIQGSVSGLEGSLSAIGEITTSLGG